MFYAYLKLIARHLTWLQQRFPKYMFAERDSFRSLVAQLLITPGMIVLIVLPLVLAALGILSLPVGDNMRALLLFIAGLLFFFMLLRTLIKELKKQSQK